MYDHLHSLDDVAVHLRDRYRSAGGRLRLGAGAPAGDPGEHDVFADPAPLMRRAVQVSGDQGVTVQELRRLFHMCGSQRWKRGVARLRDEPGIALAPEERPTAGGFVQTQVVFRAVLEPAAG